MPSFIYFTSIIIIFLTLFSIFYNLISYVIIFYIKLIYIYILVLPQSLAEFPSSNHKNDLPNCQTFPSYWVYACQLHAQSYIRLSDSKKIELKKEKKKRKEKETIELNQSIRKLNLWTLNILHLFSSRKISLALSRNQKYPKNKKNFDNCSYSQIWEWNLVQFYRTDTMIFTNKYGKLKLVYISCHWIYHIIKLGN